MVSKTYVLLNDEVKSLPAARPVVKHAVLDEVARAGVRVADRVVPLGAAVAVAAWTSPQVGPAARRVAERLVRRAAAAELGLAAGAAVLGGAAAEAGRG